MADNPNVGPEPVEAKPNHVREKTYDAPNTPQPYKDELRDLPENTAKDDIREDMSKAADAIKKRI